MQHLSAAGRLQVRAAAWTGTLSRARKRLPGAVILMYHGVGPAAAKDQQDAVTAEVFALHLRNLKRSWCVIPLRVLREALAERREIDPRWVVITLDDALANQVTRGAALLGEYDLPWSLAVPAGLISTGRSIWSHELTLLVLSFWKGGTIPGPNGAVLPVRTTEERHATLKAIRAVLDGLSASEVVKAYTDRLVEEFGAVEFEARVREDGRYVLSDWKAIADLERAGVEILSHGLFHLPQRDGLDATARDSEILESRKRIAAVLGREPAGFALPHGATCSSLARRLAAANYECALTCREDFVTERTDPMDLPRFEADLTWDHLRFRVGSLSRSRRRW